ncbi:hypothetical protein [Telmatospirillum sp. J64-1]|uniref:hypothetical protein n=1 Tax=Telmatospirillum sp. J64-1 TaxID=2502183 RepID=UPI00115C4F49|nr:hypothetical protein [Telmatospirillum sp. J64-1]
MESAAISLRVPPAGGARFRRERVCETHRGDVSDCGCQDCTRQPDCRSDPADLPSCLRLQEEDEKDERKEAEPSCPSCRGTAVMMVIEHQGEKLYWCQNCYRVHIGLVQD